MPDDIYLEDLFKAPPLRPEMFQEREPEKNRFLPEGEGLIWQGLGLLDLVVGAPARAVQGAIISGSRGGNVLEDAAKSFVGLSLDTGEWGRGEIASGSELLEELGVIQDKENFGNIVAGIGTDIASDLVMFNFIGSAKNLITKGPGAISKLSRAGTGIRYKLFKQPFKRLSHEETRAAKARLLLSLDPGNRDAFASIYRQLKEIGSEQHALRLGELKLPKELEHLQSILPQRGKKTLFGYLRARPVIATEVQRFGKTTKAFKKGEKLLQQIEEKINLALDSFDIERAQAVYRGPLRAFQEALVTPTREVLGGAKLSKEGEALVKAGTNLWKKPLQFEVRDLALSKRYIGSRRPATHMDMRVPGMPRFFRDFIPVSEPNTAGLVLEFANAPEGRLAKILRNIIPAQFDPFDQAAVLRQTGVVKHLFGGHVKATEEMHARFAQLDKLMKKAKSFEGHASAQEMGLAAEGFANAATDVQREVVGEIGEILDDLARTKIYDPVTGLTQQAIPDEIIAQMNGRYLHHIREDFQKILFKDNLKIGPWKVDLLNGVDKTVFAPPMMKRTSGGGVYSHDIWRSAKAYITALSRKIHLEPEIKRVLPDISKLNQPGTGKLFDTAKDMIGMMVGHYSRFDGYLDDLLKSFGVNTHHAATKLSTSMTGMTYSAMLGLNPRTPLLQVIQGWLNNGIAFGMFDSLKGLARALPGMGGKARLAYRESNIASSIFKSMDQEFGTVFGKSKLGRAKQTFDKIALSGLTGFDNLNRGWAYHAGFNIAKKAGLSDEAAYIHGIAAAQETQFIYGKLGASSFRNNPLGRVLLQFQSFATKQLSFLTHQFRKDPGMNTLRYLALSGMLTRSVGKFVDIGRELTPTTPGDVESLLTMDRVPSLQAFDALKDFGVAMLQEAAGVPRTEQVVDPDFAKENLLRTVFTTLVPGGTMMNRAAKYQPTLAAADPATASLPARLAYAVGQMAGAPFGGFEQPEALVGPYRTGGKGVELDRYGRKIKDLTPEEAALGMLGFRSSQSSIDRESIQQIKFLDQWVYRRYERMMTEAMRAWETGRDPEPFIARAMQIAHKQRAVIMQALKMRLRNRRMTLRERTLERAQRPVKEQFSP